MAHPIDSVHLKVALPAIFILAALTAHSILDLPYCWTPSQFTGAQVAYTRNACGGQTTRAINKGWAFPRLFLNLMAESITAVVIYFLSCHVATIASADSVVLNTAWKKAADTGKLALATGERVRQLLCSSNIAILYFLTQLLAFTLWLLAFFFIPDIMSGNAQMPSSIQQSNATLGTPEPPFMCDFQVTRLGNIVRYTMQCQQPTYASLKLATTGNKLLCLVMAMVTAVHLCYTFVVAPMIQRRNAQLIVEAAGIPPIKLGLSYGLTDLYMARALSPNGSTKKNEEKSG